MIVETKSNETNEVALSSSRVEKRTTDGEGRVRLPHEFSNAIITLEIVNDNEIRIRKVADVPEEDHVFLEQIPVILSAREAEKFLDLLENPPGPSPVLIRAFQRRAEQNG